MQFFLSVLTRHQQLPDMQYFENVIRLPEIETAFLFIHELKL